MLNIVNRWEAQTVINRIKETNIQTANKSYTSKQLLILIVIINFIGIIIEVTATGNCNVTRINNLREKDRLEIIKEKGVITIVGPPNEVPFFFINRETNAMNGIDSDIITEIARSYRHSS